MSMGDTGRQRRFDKNMPFESGPASRHVAEIENELIETQKELTRLTNDLLKERQLREAETDRADRAEKLLTVKNDAGAFHREQNILIVSECNGSILTMEEILREMAVANLAAIKAAKSRLDRRVGGFKDLVKEHFASSQEAADARKKERETKQSGEAYRDELVTAMEAGIEKAAGPQPKRTLEEISEELDSIVSPKPSPGSPTVEPGEPHKAVVAEASATAERIADMDKRTDATAIGEIDAEMATLLKPNTPESRSMLGAVKKIFESGKG